MQQMLQNKWVWGVFFVCFFKDALHDLRAQNPSTGFGKTGCEDLTQVLRLLGAQFRFTRGKDS